ncbi:esterase/lipase family protein [Pseudoxanthomonas sp. 10H]|uniref:esterase/lipase family protein n=1 Tax=Pseudoxanthomonas sp. 10H TaxID=3242729 RepID=UPI00355872A9
MLLLLGVALAGACASTGPPPSSRGGTPPSAADSPALLEANALARRAARLDDSPARTRLLLDCVLAVHAALDGGAPASPEAIALAGHCSDQVLLSEFHRRPRGWVPGPLDIAGREAELRVEGASAMFRGAYRIVPSRDVELPDGWNFRTPGFGLAIVLRTDRCEDDPRCVLYPAEGIHQWATAWIEPGHEGRPRVRIVDPATMPDATIGGRRVPLAFDALSFYQLGAAASRLPRQGIYGLLGGDDVGRRAGVYLLRDYDPAKVPVVMIHGLGSHPIIWSELSGAIWADPQLREAYQVIHIVFQTNAPLLVSRLRVQGYLDRMWAILDPENDDPARRKMVLVGHSLGGVVSRLLAVDSGPVLWDAAFTVPPAAIKGPPADVAGIRATFLLKPYPGACALVMLAAPHKGSPTASGAIGRFARLLVGRRAPEIQALRRLALDHPDAVRPEVAESYRFARLNSISTLQAMQPVRRAGEALLPVAGVRYHTIAGDLHGQGGDGVVPLESARLPGARSTRVVDHGHDLYRDPDVIAQVLGILHEERTLPCATATAAVR